MALEVLGHGNTISGGDYNPLITIGPGADNITVGPGAFNRQPVIDNSGNGRNNIIHWTTPVTDKSRASSGGSVTIGNGLFIMNFSRAGAQITVTYEFRIGSTTIIPAGELRFPLPYPRGTGAIAYVGLGNIVQSAATTTVIAQIVGSVDYIRIQPLNSPGVVSGTSPAALVSGDIIRLSVTYTQ